MPQRPKHTVLVIQFELEFNSCFRWLIFTISNFNRCSLVRDFVSCANPFSADVIFVLCLGYMYKMGWYMSAVDVLWVLLDEILLVLFGSTLSSIVSFPLTTQGQLSAVGTIVSAGYGFLCGAYMPISNFGSGLQKVLSYLPSTYGTSLLKNHMLRGIFEEMENNQLPEEMITAIRDTLDCNPKFQGSVVSVNQMVMLMVGCVVVFGIIFLCMTALPEKDGK